MGGGALKNTKTIRLNQEEFNIISQEIINSLKGYFNRFEIVPAYRNKTDFGDVDILVEKPQPEKDELDNFLKQKFDTKEIVHNKSVVSFEYKNFQVDFVFMNKKYFDTAIFYFSYNDLNNIIGRIAHKFNLKFGFDGLFYTLRNDFNNLKRDIFLTNNPKEIYEFLGYDYQTYLNGFDELENIFDFIITSKYFDSSLFDIDSLNLINRTRYKKRKTFYKFLEYLKENNINSTFKFNEDKNTYIDLIAKQFPESNLKFEIEDYNRKLDLIKKISSKFNGKVIMKLFPELNGKELGNFIIKYKESMNNFDHFILENSEENIQNSLKDFHAKFIETGE